MALLLPVSPLVSSGVVKAQQGSALLCTVFPFLKGIGAFGISSICTGGEEVPNTQTLAQTIWGYVQFGLSLVFVGIIIVAVYVIIKAAVKYIRSEGDETKIQEAQKAIKSAFVGLIALFVGIIGLVIILVVFQSLEGLNQDTGNTPADITPLLPTINK